MAQVSPRFWERVEKSAGCWLWIGYLDPQHGYGKWNPRSGGSPQHAHRVAYEQLVGPVPEGLHLDHLCRVRRCVNPDHLEPVTPRENNRRGYGFAGVHARKTHCPQGHAYDAANTYLYRGMRMCSTCRKARNEDANRKRSQERAARRSA